MKALISSDIKTLVEIISVQLNSYNINTTNDQRCMCDIKGLSDYDIIFYHPNCNDGVCTYDRLNIVKDNPLKTFYMISSKGSNIIDEKKFPENHQIIYMDTLDKVLKNLKIHKYKNT